MGEKKNSMTALVSAFSRAYHAKNNDVKIFDDSIAEKLLTKEEYSLISESMANGIVFFNPKFKGNKSEALRFIADNQLAPTPLARAAFAEKSLERAFAFQGATGIQYLILGAGYDTFAYRQPAFAEKIEIFEIDLPEMAKDKRSRIDNAGIEVPPNVHFIEADFNDMNWAASLISCESFDKTANTFSSVLGVSYYLTKESFERLICDIGNICACKSSILFDYPAEKNYTEDAGERERKQAVLAGGANEKMLAEYSYHEMERLLEKAGFLIYEHLTPDEMTEQYFSEYNRSNPEHKMTAFDNVNYCLAVKRR